MAQEDHEEDNLNQRSQCCLQQYAKHLRQFPGQLLASEPNQVGTWDHRNIIEYEDRQVEVFSSISQGNRRGHDGPKEVDCA